MAKAIYDNNGTTSTQIKKIYDYNGTTAVQLKKGYDWNGTTSAPVYSSEEVMYSLADGINTLGSWNKSNQGGDCPDVSYTGSGMQFYFRPLSKSALDYYACVTPVNVTGYNTIRFTVKSTSTTTSILMLSFGVYTSATTDSTCSASVSVGTPSAGSTYSVNVSNLSGNVYLKVFGRATGSWHNMHLSKIEMV